MADFAYTTLSDADLLVQAKDSLRAIETDHYRISLRAVESDAVRLTDLEQQAEKVRAEVARLEGATAPAAPTATKAAPTATEVTP